MTRVITIMFCWLTAATAAAQQDAGLGPDAHARSISITGSDLIALTDSLTTPFSTDRDKARAIFTWISEHIAYDCGNRNRLAEEPEEAVHPLYYTQQQLQNILATRRTRCDGYAFLFRLMCRLSGIYATTLEGYARFNGEKVNPATAEPNHAWNAACLDGDWYEIDITAASGYCEGGRFRAEQREQYFLMSEELVARTYIPVNDSRRSDNQGRIRFEIKN
ncbi:MAG: transglutaminase domain-containing protein [Saprospiraceae bacterium]